MPLVLWINFFYFQFYVSQFTWQIWRTNNSYKSNKPNRIMNKALCLGLKKSLSSPRLILTAQGMVQCTDDKSRVWYHWANQAPLIFVLANGQKLKNNLTIRSNWKKGRGACIAEWYHTRLWSSVHCTMPWAVSSSLSDDKLFVGPKHNINALFMILFGLYDSILLFVCQICHMNCETENWK